MLSWKKRISSCFKVHEHTEVKASSPLIGIVDYPAHTPRSLADADGIIQHLQSRLAGRDVRVERFVIGAASSMQEIGSIYASIDLLIQVGCCHCSLLQHCHYLPISKPASRSRLASILRLSCLMSVSCSRSCTHLLGFTWLLSSFFPSGVVPGEAGVTCLWTGDSHSEGSQEQNRL